MKDSDQPSPSCNIVPFPRRGALTPAALSSAEERILSSVCLSSDAFEDEIDRSDKEAIDVESAFKKRFGFDAPRHHRARIIELKYRDDLTDSEIRALRWSRSLEIGPDGARIYGPAWMAAIGWVHIALLFVVVFGVLLAGASNGQAGVAELAKVIMIEALLIALIFAFHRMYVFPSTINRRVKSFLRYNGESTSP